MKQYPWPSRSTAATHVDGKRIALPLAQDTPYLLLKHNPHIFAKANPLKAKVPRFFHGSDMFMAGKIFT
jgi:hypothetical protein